MVTKLFLTYPPGLHARPSVALASLLKKFNSQVTIINEKGDTASGRSVLDLLALCVQAGQEIKIEVTGEDEIACLKAITEFVLHLNTKQTWEME